MLVLFNTLPYQRHDYAFVSMIVENKDFVLRDDQDHIIPYTLMNQDQEVSAEIEYYNGIHNFHDGGEILEGSKFRVQFKVDASILPPMGFKVLKVCFNQKHQNEVQGNVYLHEQTHVENQYLDIYVNENGSLEVTNKKTGKTYHEVHTFVESGDDGDEYNYSPPKNDSLISTKNMKPTIEIVESSAIEVVYKMTYQITAPERIEDHYRVEETATSLLTTFVSIRSSDRKVHFKTVISNCGQDHIIKAVFQDRTASMENCSQDHFGTIIRSNTILKQRGLENGATEEELPIYPMKRFVKLNHNDETFSVISGGPMEYTIENNDTICLTLLRSVGKFGKADLLIRPGRSSGYRLDAPSSQLLKDIESEYAIYFGDDYNIDDLIQESEIMTTPVTSRYVNKFERNHETNLNWEYSLCQMNDGLELIALKQCENGEGTVYRFNNNTEHDIENATFIIPEGQTCYMSNAKEKQLEKCVQTGQHVTLPKVLSQTFITVIVK